MSCGKCVKCTKTVYQTEKVDAAGGVFHKMCFRCNEPTCNISLTLQTFQAFEGQVYCNKHVPKPKATQVTDAVSLQTAMAAPRRKSEGLGVIQKGTGEKPLIDASAMNLAHATAVPKPRAEALGTVHKGANPGA
eukprot:comp12689_c0_seq1/m.7781 comp12689_c0_seq1/g.7781  ORF comp12689_c0_seq1/g.7781 comp12689_c0_seq1/m.7781 type:complete len:134 (-) comp12689_c0_seq1:495-896(-)